MLIQIRLPRRTVRSDLACSAGHYASEPGVSRHPSYSARPPGQSIACSQEARPHWDDYRDLTGYFFCTRSFFLQLPRKAILFVTSYLYGLFFCAPTSGGRFGEFVRSAASRQLLMRKDTVMCITSEKHDERTHRGSRKRYVRTHHGSAKARRTNPPWPQRARRKCAERTQPPQTRARRKCAERTQMLEPPPARRNATKRSHFSQSARQNSCLASGIGRRKFFAKRSQSPILGDHVTDPGRRQNAPNEPNGPTMGHGRKCAERTHRGLRKRNERVRMSGGKNTTNEPTEVRASSTNEPEAGSGKRDERTHRCSGRHDERTHQTIGASEKTGQPNRAPIGGLTGSPGVVSIETTLAGMS
jgi:hypothetical protein